ncbi:beta-lactamase/transpeptidase-like protein [Xylariomycetidae sp. FL0641]|nr:beta-lactamase/transpeptidase-like protein [Xylariomycetidae sp. FL0641]
MGLFRTLVWLAAVQFTFTQAKLNCPLYGLGYPKPTALRNVTGITKAANALENVFSQYIDKSNQTGADRFSYSVEVFSATQETPLWSHYWTAKNLAMMNTTGVKKIDEKTVYRVGSVSKIYTILTFLAEVGDASWNEPITKYIPEIAAMVPDGADTSHSLSMPDWNSITIGSLASQASGLMRDYALLGELTQGNNQSQATAIGLPALSSSDIPPCGNIPVCNKTQFFEGLMKIPPSFSPFVTPAYSDIGYALLGYALEQMTGKPFSQSFDEKIVKPLNLTRTFYKTPNDSLGIIPGNRYLTTWAFDMGHESPTGNMYASASDLSALGRAILKSTLLPQAVTRRWLRPVMFSSDPKSSVGSPWGVRQLQLPLNSSYQFATTFNKAGSLGKYSTLLAIIPDFDIGFSIMAAGDVPPSLAMDIADTLSNTYLPTMLGVAAFEANNTYAGHYASPDTALNSSLSIAVDPARPGLVLGPWVSNGTDLLWLAVAIGQNVTREYWSKIRPSAQLYPNGLWDATLEGGKRVGFKAVFEDLSLPNISNPFTTDCSTWVNVAGTVYGSQPLDEFIFDIDAAGKVTGVENAALRNRLDKVA